MKAIIVSVFAVVALTACGGSGDDGPEFPTDMFAPAVQERIDKMAVDGDCDGLQEEFDTADAGNNPGKSDMLTYIDAKMKEAGCY